MDLTDRLISDFVKATAPKEDTGSHEYTAHGVVTAVGNDGTASIMFDGGTVATPCKTAVTVSVGDKVIVTVKDRQATVTSNVSKNTVNADYLEGGNAKFSGTVQGSTLKGSTFVDSTYNFKMNIGSAQHVSGQVTPALKIEGYVNGQSSKDYLEIEICLYQLSGATIPQLYIAGTTRNNPGAAEKGSVSIGVGEYGIDFYGSLNNGAQRVHSSLPWGYNP